MLRKGLRQVARRTTASTSGLVYRHPLHLTHDSMSDFCSAGEGVKPQDSHSKQSTSELYLQPCLSLFFSPSIFLFLIL